MHLTGPVDPTRIKPAPHGSLIVCLVGSGRVKRLSKYRGSGQEAFKSHGSGRVGPKVFNISRVGSGRVRGLQFLAGGVRSGQDMSKFSGVGSDIGSADPTRPDP